MKEVYVLTYKYLSDPEVKVGIFDDFALAEKIWKRQVRSINYSVFDLGNEGDYYFNIETHTLNEPTNDLPEVLDEIILDLDSVTDSELQEKFEASKNGIIGKTFTNKQ